MLTGFGQIVDLASVPIQQNAFVTEMGWLRDTHDLPVLVRLTQADQRTPPLGPKRENRDYERDKQHRYCHLHDRKLRRVFCHEQASYNSRAQQDSTDDPAEHVCLSVREDSSAVRLLSIDLRQIAPKRATMPGTYVLSHRGIT
jgi:hypothetical protein